MGAAGVWGTVPNWVVAIIATLALLVAAWQLFLVRRANQASVEIARANLLRQIDAEFESDEMYRSRKAVRALRNRAEHAVRQNNESAPEDRIAQLSALEFSKQLTGLWRTARTIKEENVEADSPSVAAADRYAELMRLPNWYETLGYMIRRQLLPRKDILEIYDAAVVPTMLYFKEHIKIRREEGPYLNPRFLEHAEWLCREAQRHIDSKKPQATRIDESTVSPFASG